MQDSYDLQRFVEAQDAVYEDVLDELRSGRKQSHWMWFIFPQLRGLGHSALAQKFGISSLDEAAAYLQHSILGNRLRECSRLVAEIEGRSISVIFGYPDDMKFQSCMTLFEQATEDSAVFKECLHKYFHDQPDRQTLALLGR